MLEEVGAVEIVKNPRSKNMRLTVNPDASVRISIPLYCPFDQAVALANGKKEWIKQTITKFEKQREKDLVFLPETEYKTRHHKLMVQTRMQRAYEYVIENGIILVLIPSNVDITGQEPQDWIKKAIRETWRMEAKLFLSMKVMDLAGKYNFTYNNVNIRNSKTRWGSCSSNGNINLSLHLMRLPDVLIDFVILHELTHTIHKNHGPEFHELLNKICGGREKELNAWLRSLRIDDYRMLDEITE